MKKIIGMIFLVMVFVAVNFAQNCPSCCQPYPVTVSGMVTGQDYESQSLVAHRQIGIAVYNTTLGQHLDNVRVNAFGYYSYQITTCHYFLLQPYIMPKGQAMFPNTWFVTNPVQYYFTTDYSVYDKNFALSVLPNKG